MIFFSLFCFIFKAKDYVKSSHHILAVTFHCDLAEFFYSILSRLILVMKIITFMLRFIMRETERERRGACFISWRNQVSQQSHKYIISLTFWGQLASLHIGKLKGK